MHVYINVRIFGQPRPRSRFRSARADVASRSSAFDPAASADGRRHTGLPRSGIRQQILLMPRPRSPPCADSRGRERWGGRTSLYRSPTMSIPKMNRDQTIQNRLKYPHCSFFIIGTILRGRKMVDTYMRTRFTSSLHQNPYF